MESRPDRILPILSSWGLVGEIQIWRGEFADLPQEESNLFQNFVSETSKAFERTLSFEVEKMQAKA
jgi:hypothetical protein